MKNMGNEWYLWKISWLFNLATGFFLEIDNYNNYNKMRKEVS